MITVTKQTARNFLLRSIIYPKLKQNNVFELLQCLEAIQLDPVATVERNHHLVAGLRLPDFKPLDLENTLKNGQAFEYFAQAACILPMNDYPLFTDSRKQFEIEAQEDLKRYDSTVSYILSKLANEGPLPSNAFESENKVRGGWSAGEGKTKETSHVLTLLFQSGLIQVVGREGATRFFARTEDAIPVALREQELEQSSDERSHALLKKYARAYRLFSADDARYGWQRGSTAKTRRSLHQQFVNQEIFTEVQIEGVKRTYAILTEDLPEFLQCQELDMPTGIQFVSPLDSLLWYRERIVDVYDFYYRWEIYTPKLKRTYGAYVMPILEDGNLIGRIDPLFDRKNGTLNIQLITLEPDGSWSMTRKIRLLDALNRFAKQIGAENVSLPEAITIKL